MPWPHLAALLYDLVRMASLNSDFILDTETMKRVRRVLATARAGGTIRLLLSGPDGTGKSHAVTRVAVEEPGRPLLVLHGTPDAMRSPYQPFAQALWTWLQRAGRDRLVKKVALEGAAEFLALVPVFGVVGDSIKGLLTDLGAPPASPLGENISNAQLVQRALNRIAKKYKLVLLLEDFPRHDPESNALLSAMLRLGANRFSIVVTIDPVAVFELPGDEQKKIVELRKMLERACDFTVVEVPPLSRDETGLFLEGYVGAGIFSAGQVDAAHAKTGGNLLFLKQFVAQLHGDGILVAADGSFRVQTASAWPEIPQWVDEYVQARLSTLTEQEQDVLKIASVLGLEFTTLPISSRLAIADVEVKKSLRRLETMHRLVKQSGERTYTFTEPFVRDAIYHSLGLDLAREYHALIAESLREEGADDESYAIYRHLWASGRAGEATEYLRRAAERADEAGAAPDAVRYWRELCQVLRQTHAAAEEPRRAEERLYRAAVAAEDMGRFPDAISAFAWLHEHAHGARERAVALLRLGVCQWSGAGPHEARSSLDTLLDGHARELDEAQLLEARMVLASVQYHVGEWSSARELYRQCFRNEQLGEDPVLLAETRRNVNMFYIAEMALPLLRRSIHDLRRRKELSLYWEMQHNLGCTHLLFGELHAARTTFQAASAAFKDVGNYREHLSENNLGIVAMLRGDFEEATQRFLAVADTQLSPFEKVSAECHLAIIEVLRGSSNGVGTLEGLVDRFGSDVEIQLRETVFHNLGWAQLRANRLAEAAESLLRALPAGDSTPWSAFRSARTIRLLQQLRDRGVTLSIDHTAAGELSRLNRTGRRDRWQYLSVDYAFSELWCWE